ARWRPASSSRASSWRRQASSRDECVAGLQGFVIARLAFGFAAATVVPCGVWDVFPEGRQALVATTCPYRTTQILHGEQHCARCAFARDATTKQAILGAVE